LALIAIIIVAIITFFLGGQRGDAPENEPAGDNEHMMEETGEMMAGDEMMDSGVAPQTYTVRITAGGFEPGTLTVRRGDTVIFRNNTSSPVWPASAVHPVHMAYPGSGIEKCGTTEAGNIFDACGGLEQSDTFSFQFGENGTWRYHNHLNPSMTGTIVVE